MPRAKTTQAATVSELLLSDSEQAALNAERELGIVREAGAVPTLKYSPEDMQKLDQFAIGLLGDTSTAAGCILEGRIRAAYLRAEVMLTIRKEIAALEIQ